MKNSFTVEAAEKIGNMNVEEAARLLEIEPSRFIDEAIRFDIWIYIEVPVGAPLAATYVNSSRRALDALRHDDFGVLKAEEGHYSDYVLSNDGAAFQLRVGSEVLRVIRQSGVAWQQRFWSFRRSAPLPDFNSAVTGVRGEADFRDPAYEATACFITPIVILDDRYLPDFYVIKRSHLLVSGHDLAKWMGYSGHDTTGKYPIFPRDRHNRSRIMRNLPPMYELKEEQIARDSFDEEWAQKVVRLVDENIDAFYTKQIASTSHFTVDRGAGLRDLVKVYCGFRVHCSRGEESFPIFDKYLERTRYFSDIKLSDDYKRKLFHSLFKPKNLPSVPRQALGAKISEKKFLEELRALRVGDGMLAIIAVATETICQESLARAPVLDEKFEKLGIRANNRPVIRKILALHDKTTGPKSNKVGTRHWTP